MGVCLRHLIRYKPENKTQIEQNQKIFIDILDECSNMLTALLSYREQLDFDWILEVVLGSVEILRNLKIRTPDFSSFIEMTNTVLKSNFSEEISGKILEAHSEFSKDSTYLPVFQSPEYFQFQLQNLKKPLFSSKLKIQIVKIFEISIGQNFHVWKEFVYCQKGIVAVGQLIRTTMNMDEAKPPVNTKTNIKPISHKSLSVERKSRQDQS